MVLAIGRLPIACTKLRTDCQRLPWLLASYLQKQNFKRIGSDDFCRRRNLGLYLHITLNVRSLELISDKKLSEMGAAELKAFILRFGLQSFILSSINWS
jgi:hypothetical protein